MVGLIARDKRGVTIIESVITIGLLSLLLVGLVSVLGTMFRIWASGSSGTSANSYAAIAMRKLVLDIEPAISASVNASGQLVVVFPYLDTSTGLYDKGQTGSTVTYYRSGATGTESSTLSTSTYLWRSASGVKKRLAKNIQSVTFTVSDSRLVRVNLTGYDAEGTALSPNLIQVSVKLRNN